MNPQLPNRIDALSGLRVAVIGEAMLDRYLDGSVGRFCPEAPVPVFDLAGSEDLPGGAANTAANAAALGAKVDFLSVTGDDEEAAALRCALDRAGVSSGGLYADPSRQTLTKLRVLAASQLLLRVDRGSMEDATGAAEQALLDRLQTAFATADAVIVSDYRYGVWTPRMIRALCDLQARYRRVLVADSRRLQVFRGAALTAAKPNYDEATALLGAGRLDGFGPRAEAIAPHGEQILALTGARVVAVTLDSEGAVVFERGRAPHRAYALAPRVACVAGAGDTFTAALALGLAAGASGAEATELASAAAAVAVAKDRTALCSASELRQFAQAGGKSADTTSLAAVLKAYRRQGRKIVFTNGCFDILHRGHITYLHRAKMLGDVLVVGVNSDEGIRRLKGPQRPINALEDRLQVLGALGCVDHLVPFDEDTPCELIRAIRPDVFVKGGDYSRKQLPEAPLVEELGGVVQILPFLNDRSTTGIIERIRQAESSPARRGVPATISQ